MKKIFYAFLTIVTLFTLTGCNKNGNSNNTLDVDLTVNDNEPKYVSCILVEENVLTDELYSYEIFLPNSKHYAFLNDDTVPTCRNQNVDINNLTRDLSSGESEHINHSEYNKETYDYEHQFSIYIHYNLENIRSLSETYLERVTDTMLYIGAGKPKVYGDENGYWYVYKDKGTDDGKKKINLVINKLIESRGNVNNVVYEYNQLDVSIMISYTDEISKARLNYIINDLKQMFKEKYNIDISEFSVDMLKS